MKLLARNTTLFEYLPYNGVMSDLNEYGEHTGEYHPSYGDPETYRGTISMPSGQVSHMLYGQDIRYTHTLLMDKDVGIDEQGIIRWKGRLYEITAVLPSLNNVVIALKRMTADEGKAYIPDPEPNETEDGEGE